MRLWRYDIHERHQEGVPVLRGRFMGHLDLPRIEDGGLSSAMWSVTTNPFRTKRGRWKTVQKNFRKLRQVIDETDELEVASTYQQYMDARARGKHVCLLSIQGGNALTAAHDGELPDPDLLRVTLVHLTNSELGQSSQPIQLQPARGLSAQGREMVQMLNQRRVFVDLAHIARRAFWEAIEVHDKSQPILVTHTGVDAVTPHWRNIDDDQIRAIADTGGVVGVMFHRTFLQRPGPQDRTMVLDHLEHIIDVAGEDFAALGSDYDGAIHPPDDLKSGDSYPRLIQEMLDRGWSTGRIEKVLGANFLRSLRELRG
jgi:membrane dipeptidase